jgi:hypothetical protein
MGRDRLVLEGRTFGLLTVIAQESAPEGGTRWHCECACGNRCVVWGYDLKRGNTQSCGCLRYRKGKETPRARKPTIRRR